MHKSFPCKFFHRRGECSQGADCKFSHEPLNDVTTKLLNEALKRERDLYELTKNAEQESSSSGRPENTEESEIIEANGTCDALLPPLRPYFYNSAETNAEKESLLCPTEQLAEDIEEAVPSHPSDAAQPHPPPSSNINHEEPVCYSVEAVLGPQLFKPFPSFFTTPGCEATQSKVPYSVDAVLRSCKSAPLTVRTVSYTPNTDGEEITDPLLSSESRNVKVLYSQNTANAVNQSQEKMFKSLSSLQVNTGLVSKTCPSLTPASRDYKKQSVNMPESLKPAQRASHEVKLELLHSPVTVAEKSSNNKEDVRGSMRLPADNTSTSKSEGVLSFGRINRKSIFSRPPSQTCTSKHPTQLRPHLSVVTLDLHASIKPPCPSSSFTEFKDGAAATVEPVTSSIKTRDSANSVGRHFAAKQPTEILLHSKMTQSGLKRGTRQRYSTEVTAGCSSKMSHSGDLAVGCKNTLKRPFHSLFASSIIDILQPIDDSVTSSSCPQGFILSSCPSPQSADCTSICVKSAVEPDKASARSFLSLFAAPLSAAPPPCMKSQSDYSRTSSCSQKSNQSVDNASNSKQRTSNLGTPLPCLVRTDVKEIPHVPRSHNFSPNPKLDNEDSSAEHINQPRKQMVVPVCLVSDSLSAMSASPSTPHVQQQDTSSHRGSAVATTANSVLKTLFLSLSPYQRDAEQQ
ncbi:uncharacterized protein LOC115014858 [Cottoperca gobio]|uniref:Uncharacterized protein LOC115014858 n=1 Tax=Cottoperca gobio TaxID=56716 RepID=A0A6J2QJL9_COTGO|nr:uncharacterized protein LOC115014858 [Cottoperca gobio]